MRITRLLALLSLATLVGCNNGSPTAPPVDTDGDGVADVTDNCVSISNPDQADIDLDGAGDACDPACTSVELMLDIRGPVAGSALTGVDFTLNYPPDLALDLTSDCMIPRGQLPVGSNLTVVSSPGSLVVNLRVARPIDWGVSFGSTCLAKFTVGARAPTDADFVLTNAQALDPRDTLIPGVAVGVHLAPCP